MSFDTEKLIRKFSEEPEIRFIKDVVNESEPWKKELTKVSESTHYRKPADNGQVTELQPDFKVKTMVDPKHFNMIYNSGARETLNELQTFLITYMNKTENSQLTALDVYKAVNVWANNQRNSYL